MMQLTLDCAISTPPLSLSLSTINLLQSRSSKDLSKIIFPNYKMYLSKIQKGLRNLNTTNLPLSTINLLQSRSSKVGAVGGAQKQPKCFAFARLQSYWAMLLLPTRAMH